MVPTTGCPSSMVIEGGYPIPLGVLSRPNLLPLGREMLEQLGGAGFLLGHGLRRLSGGLHQPVQILSTEPSVLLVVPVHFAHPFRWLKLLQQNEAA